MKERFLGLTITACTMEASIDSHWVSDCGDEYPLSSKTPDSDDGIQQEIDTLHVYLTQAMLALDDVLKPLHDVSSPEALAKSLDHAEASLLNYHPQTDGSDELLNLSHARVDAYRLAKLAQRLRSLYLEATSRN